MGITGNELADGAAREVIKQENFLNVPLPKGDICAAIKRKSREHWKEKWRQLPESSNKLREITDSVTPLPYSSCEIRQWERILTRLRLGHSRLTYAYLMNKENPPICEHCQQAVMTIKHALIECPQHRHARRRAFGKTSLTLKDMLLGSNARPAGPLARYLDDIKLTHLL